MRPPSIVMFERVFICTILIGIATAILWVLYPPPIVFPAGAPPALAQMTHVFTIGAIVVGIAINLLLIYFIARRGSDVARWIFVVLFAIGLAGFVKQFVVPVPVVLPPGARIIGVAQLVLQAVCVWLTFRPDAKSWFRK